MISKFASQISEAVATLHHLGFAHCDLKPHNVMIDVCSEDPIIKYKCRLADFGLTQRLDDSHGQVKAFEFNSLPGLTVLYAAPEAIRHFRQHLMIVSRVDHYRRSDVYSLSVMLYELVVRQLAWQKRK
jgi:serine/threonine protein kinase